MIKSFGYFFFFSWLSSLEGTKWMTYLANLLRTACLVVNVMSKERRSVVVHCSDGWDRTSQIVSLAELMMDPYYRTVEVRWQTSTSFSWKVEQILVSVYPLFYKPLLIAKNHYQCKSQEWNCLYILKPLHVIYNKSFLFFGILYFIYGKMAEWQNFDFAYDSKESFVLGM